MKWLLVKKKNDGTLICIGEGEQSGFQTGNKCNQLELH